MDFSFWLFEFMLSFLIASSGPETAMKDMQRSASSGTREPRAPSSVLRTCGLQHAASCGGNRVEGKFSLLQSIEIARNGKIYGVWSDGASMQVEIETSRKHAASEVSCRLPRRSLAVAASSTAPVRRKHDPVAGAVAPARRQRRIAQRGVAHAPPPGRCGGATRSSRVARGRRQMESPGNGAATA
jgi:hypothetical protein